MISLDQIEIRTDYRPGDIGHIVQMHGSLYDFGLHFESYVAETLAAFYNTLDPMKERIWIAEHNSHIVGTIALKNTDGEAQLRYFLIDPDYRGIGLGKQLMDLFIATMQQLNYQASFLLTAKELETAAHLYKKYGYKYVSSAKMDFGLEELRYELKLP